MDLASVQSRFINALRARLNSSIEAQASLQDMLASLQENRKRLRLQRQAVADRKTRVLNFLQTQFAGEAMPDNQLTEAFLRANDFPPVTKQSLAGLDIQNIMSNIKLRHDVSFDRDLSFRPNLDGRRGQEKRRAADQYWNALLAELQVYLTMEEEEETLEDDFCSRELKYMAQEKELCKNSLLDFLDESNLEPNALDIPRVSLETEREHVLRHVSPLSGRKRPASADDDTIVPERRKSIPEARNARLFDPNQSKSTPWSPYAECSVETHKATQSQPQPHSPIRQQTIPKPQHQPRQPGLIELQRYDPRYLNLLLQPDSRPISQEQLVSEVKSIYAGLTMVETKCIHVDRAQTAAAQDASGPDHKLAPDHWQALIALHRTLLHEHHDFFLASQYPSASPALKSLAAKYSMPARMWKHGIHSFLELLRHRLPESIDYILAFIYVASQPTALYENVLRADTPWAELVAFLNALVKTEIQLQMAPSQTQDINTLSATNTFHANGEREDELPLPEDYLIRGLVWAQEYFPEKWFERGRDEPAFEDAWIKCVGDLGRYRMAIEDKGIRDRDTWTGVARSWYTKASDKNPSVGWLYHHLAVLARPNALQQLYLYSRSLTCVQPFPSARESIVTLLDPTIRPSTASHAIFRRQHTEGPIDQRWTHLSLVEASPEPLIIREQRCCRNTFTPPDFSSSQFADAHVLLFEKSLSWFNETMQGFRENFKTRWGGVTSKWKEQSLYIALAQVGSWFDHSSSASTTSPLLSSCQRYFQQLATNRALYKFAALSLTRLPLASALPRREADANHGLSSDSAPIFGEDTPFDRVAYGLMVLYPLVALQFRRNPSMKTVSFSVMLAMATLWPVFMGSAFPAEVRKTAFKTWAATTFHYELLDCVESPEPKEHTVKFLGLSMALLFIGSTAVQQFSERSLLVALPPSLAFAAVINWAITNNSDSGDDEPRRGNRYRREADPEAASHF